MTCKEVDIFCRSENDGCIFAMSPPQGARFVGYDAKEGVWRFEVEHFSRYGLLDSDDEGGAEQGVPSGESPLGGSDTAGRMDSGEWEGEEEEEEEEEAMQERRCAPCLSRADAVLENRCGSALLGPVP